MISRRESLLILGAPALEWLAPRHASASRLLVVVTQKTSALSDLSLRELKRLYQSEPVNGPDGNPLVPLNQVLGTPARVDFDQLVLKMSPDVVARYWVDRKIRGQTGAPKAIPSLDLLRRAVAGVPGTLTYLSANDVTAELKVVTVDSKRPTDAGYVLQIQ
jgi:hypothetical protein